MSISQRPNSRNDFEIAILCTWQFEAEAVEYLFDEDYESNGGSYGKAQDDSNAYTIGRIASQDVVLAYHAGPEQLSSGAVASSLLKSFPKIKLAILVGTCGITPETRSGETLKLGDVVISNNVVLHQYEDAKGRLKVTESRDTLADEFGRLNLEVLALLQKIKTNKYRNQLEEKIPAYARTIYQQKGMEASRYPGWTNDRLYCASYRHKHRRGKFCKVCSDCMKGDDPVCKTARFATCENLGCDEAELVQRNVDRLEPRVLIGQIAFGTSLLRSPHQRDSLVKRQNATAFGKETSGSWTILPTIIIKSGTNYTDTHRNLVWTKYAAATAAACTKGFLEMWRRADRSVTDESTAPSTQSTDANMHGPYSTNTEIGDTTASGHGKVINIGHAHFHSS